MSQTRVSHEEAQNRAPQLDGLRAIAVFAVLIEHSFHLIRTPWMLFSFSAPGPVGVRLFFVLSGFLITGILLRARTEAENRGAGLTRVWMSFYVRRALRIFPLAYAAIAVAWLVGIPAARAHLAWYLTYTSNVLSAGINLHSPTQLAGSFDPSLGHFWSLALEEQFYLVWPLLILMCPTRALGGVMKATFLTAGLVRGLIAFRSPVASYVLLVSRADALALGGLIALWLHQGMPQQSVRRWLGVGGLIVAAISVFLTGRPWVTGNEWAAILLSGWLVLAARNGFKGTVGRILSSRTLVYLGTISYGVYVWHYMIPETFDLLAYRLHIEARWPAAPGLIQLAALSAASVAAASLSWWMFEKRLNDLKRYVPYVADRLTTVSDQHAPVTDLLAADASRT